MTYPIWSSNFECTFEPLGGHLQFSGRYLKFPAVRWRADVGRKDLLPAQKVSVTVVRNSWSRVSATGGAAYLILLKIMLYVPKVPGPNLTGNRSESQTWPFWPRLEVTFESTSFLYNDRIVLSSTRPLCLAQIAVRLRSAISADHQ